MTRIKYECDSGNPTGTLAKIENFACLRWNLVPPPKDWRLIRALNSLLSCYIWWFTCRASSQCPPLQWRRMGVIASKIISNSIVCSIVYSDKQQRKHESTASVAGDGKSSLTSASQKAGNEAFPYHDIIMYDAAWNWIRGAKRTISPNVYLHFKSVKNCSTHEDKRLTFIFCETMNSGMSATSKISTNRGAVVVVINLLCIYS